MNIHQEHNSLIKLKTSNTQIASNTYQECMILSQARIIDQNELNDDHCFKCNKKGQLYCCDKCFRAFHKTCINTRRFSKVWSCQYCNNQHLCVNCSQILHQNHQELSMKSKYTCTICFRFVHNACHSVPQNIMKSQSHYFQQAQNFVCLQCLKQFGFKMVLAWNRTIINQEEKLFYFVNINTRSPIHCGWFQEENLRDVPRYKEADQLIEADVCEFPIIERIIRMKVPLQYKQQDIQQLLNLFVKNQRCAKENREYGSRDNVYFLVVWEGSDYTKATWQDEQIISINNAKNKSSSQFTKYILYCKLELAIKAKLDLQLVYDQFRELLPTVSMERRRQKEIAQMLQHFTLNIPECKIMCLYIGQQYTQTIDFIYFYLHQKYSKNLIDSPTLILCSSNYLSRWQRKAKQICVYLNAVSLKGSEANIQEIKMKQLNFQLINQNKFQILIVPLEKWTKEKRYLCSKNIKFESIIFDQNVPQSMIDEIDFQNLLNYDHKICMYSKSSNNKKQKKMSQFGLKLSQGFVYDMQTYQIYTNQMKTIKKVININEQLEKISKNDIINKQKEEFKLLQRLALLKYFISFGFNYSADQAFEKILKSTPGIFKKEDLQRFINFTQKFMSALFSFKNSHLTTEHSNYYFMDLEPLPVYKQICKLAKLKKMVQDHRQNIEKFSFEKKFKVFYYKYVIQLDYWNGIHDYLLSALVIEKGFGKWTEIAYSKEWFKYTCPCHFEHIDINKPQVITFADYVLKILHLNKQPLNCSIIKVEEILRERVNYLLYLMK